MAGIVRSALSSAGSGGPQPSRYAGTQMELGVPLPPVDMRQGGSQSSTTTTTSLNPRDKISNISRRWVWGPSRAFYTSGCGPGRLAIGLIASEWSGTYLGIEVKDRHVQWATTEITSRFPDYRSSAWMRRMNDTTQAGLKLAPSLWKTAQWT